MIGQKKFVIRNLEEKIELYSNDINYNDYKSKLQEYIQRDMNKKNYIQSGK
ncbi:hypothetical protein [Thermobrachium celere]|uniref:hypothetical protein n=1 Tax=Thermobrachium celere TaxID=53422 RepID=UPI001A3ED5E7|nr:hypothetical protein [Thermobrachium celere]GFR36518.1 hypothetical protein TCEA9_23300 [Thermobrachium celere]